MTLEALINLWEGWGYLTDLDDVQKNYFNDRGVFLVVEVDGHIVGTGAFHRYTEEGLFSAGGRLQTSDESLRSEKGVCELRRITLLPECGGQKLAYLAYALMQELIHRAHEMGYTKMVL